MIVAVVVFSFLAGFAAAYSVVKFRAGDRENGVTFLVLVLACAAAISIGLFGGHAP